MSMAIETMLVSSPDVCGGRLRIDGTRITVQQIVALYKQGYSPEAIADEYGHLTLAQIYTALAYYHANRAAMEKESGAEEVEAERLLQEHRQSQNRR